jgi:hypothetical protein
MRTPGSFLSGILIGMLAALGIVFLMMNDFSPSKLFGFDDNKSSGDTIVDLTDIKNTRSSKSAKAYNAATTPINQEEILPFDSSSIAQINADSSQFSTPVNNEEIVVRRDELIKSMVIEAIRIGKPNANPKTDSLINIFQGGQASNDDSYRLEFWQSPVNFKGFKLIRNGIITFGLNPEDVTRLFEFNGSLILRNGATYFKLYPTDRFMPYQRITDENTIKQLRS